MATGSGWGYGRWGSTLYWGYQLTGLLGKASIVSDAVVAALAQTTNQVLQYSAKVEIDGTDVSAYCGPFTIEHRGRGGVSSAQFEVFGTSVTINLHQSVVLISVGVADPNTGTVYWQERFRGKAHGVEKIETAGGIEQSQVTCYDAGYVLAENKPSYSGVIETADGITVLDYLETELAAQGFGPPSGNFTDDTISAFYPYGYKSARDAMYAACQTAGPSTFYFDSTGNLIVTDYDDTTVQPYTFPLTCQFFQDPAQLVAGYCNQVIHEWWLYSSTNGLGVTGARTVNDTTDQATKGVIQKAPSPYIRSFGYADYATSALRNAAADTIAAAYMDSTQQSIYRWGSALNPFVFPGHVVTLTKTDSTTTTVRIEDCTDTGGFEAAGGGFWTTWSGRATS